eukprot:SAG11_NODE_665_length_7847_cov_13.635132_7_plen_179_part_00
MRKSAPSVRNSAAASVADVAAANRGRPRRMHSQVASYAEQPAVNRLNPATVDTIAGACISQGIPVRKACAAATVDYEGYRKEVRKKMMELQATEQADLLRSAKIALSSTAAPPKTVRSKDPPLATTIVEAAGAAVGAAAGDVVAGAAAGAGRAASDLTPANGAHQCHETTLIKSYPRS